MGTVDGMDVHHKDNNPLNNDPENLAHMDRSENRREPRLREREVKQDKDVKDREGTQPAKYYAKDTEGDAMAKSTKAARARHFEKKKKGPAPGEASAKTKPSKHTKKFKQMYGEVLSKDATVADYVDDFRKSDAPQFKGKSDKKIQKMAVAAYLDRRDKNEELDERNLSKAQQDRLDDLEAFLGHLQNVRPTPTRRAEMDAIKKKIKKLKSEFDPDDIDESWSMDEMTGINVPELIRTTVHRLTHPKGYEKIIQKYIQDVGMEKQKSGHQDSNAAVLADVARLFGLDRAKPLQMYVNKLVKKGKLPQELAAEVDPDVDESLWANIHKKRQRIKQGSGEKMRKKGEKGAPTSAQMKRAKGESVDEGTYFTRTRSAKSRGQIMKKQLRPKIEPLMRDIGFKRGSYKMEPSKDASQLIVTVDKSDLEKVTKTLRSKLGLPNILQIVSEDAPNTRDAMKRFKAGDAGFSDKAHLKAKGLIPRADGTKKKSPKYEEFSEVYHLDEKITALVNKAKKTGMPYGILKKVYDRGMAAYKPGHRPGASPQQWALARVNSFTTKSSGTWGGADKDLAKQVRGESVEILKNNWGEVTEAAEYQGRKVQLNNPTQGDTKKYKVYVKNDKGNVVKVEFGDPNMSIKRDDPERRKAFRARHGCDTNPGPKHKAKYWSCKFWSTKSVTDLMKG